MCKNNYKNDHKNTLFFYIPAAVCNFSSVGQLKPGYHADFIVLDKDIFSISPEDIDKVSVDETFIGGEKIYKRENQ